MGTHAVVAARVLVTALAGCLLTMLDAPRAAAQCPTGYMVTGTTQFGQAIAVSGNLVVVGDPTLSLGGTAIVLRRATWGWKTEYSLFSPLPEPYGRFGEAVAISGDWAAVGAPGELGNAGTVHLFHRECEPGSPCTWVWITRLTPAEAAPGDRFGAALAIDGARLVVAAPSSDLESTECGALFVFELEGSAWTQVQTLTAGPEGPPFAGLGACVALAGDLVAAGSKSANKAWIFELVEASFGPAQVLTDPDAGQFGMAVATDGARVLVGAPGTSATAIKSGAAYLFAPPPGGPGPGAWTKAALLAPSGYPLFASFGTSVALDGKTAAIGATGANGGEGAVYVYHDPAATGASGASWPLFATFENMPGPSSSGMGITAALDDDTLLAGARILFGPPGVVYLFGGVATWNELGGGLAGSAGMPALAVGGSLCGGDSLIFAISHGKPNAAALLIIGLAATPQPWKGGVLWPAPDIVVPAQLGAAGDASLTLGVPIGQPSAQPVIAQAWIADAGAQAGVSATPAMSAKTP